MAKPVRRYAPEYPRYELNRGRAGWVKLSFVVTEEGAVEDPIVEDSSGSPRFEEAALDVVRKWRYEPATLEGQPVQQCQTAMMVRFELEPKALGAGKKYRSAHREISRLLDEGRIDEAGSLIIETETDEALNAYEIARLWMLKAIVAGERGDESAQLAALKRTIASDGAWIEDELYHSLLRSVLALKIRLGRYGSALATYEEYVEATGGDEGLGALRDVVARIRDAASGPAPLLVEASIGDGAACDECRSSWHYRPLRKAFTIADIQGVADELEIRCDWQRVTDTVRPGVQWNIPESWGDCRVIVTGEKGTRFSFYEMPEA
ncbi:TonB family protein [Lentisalinibacter sediminis]|uniref:TonB family protein n=1 Tax=Lentisalinibacter sediminis TaxID=2992237 RepID=UPI0038660D7B